MYNLFHLEADTKPQKDEFKKLIKKSLCRSVCSAYDVQASI